MIGIWQFDFTFPHPNIYTGFSGLYTIFVCCTGFTLWAKTLPSLSIHSKTKHNFCKIYEKKKRCTLHNTCLPHATLYQRRHPVALCCYGDVLFSLWSMAQPMTGGWVRPETRDTFIWVDVYALNFYCIKHTFGKNYIWNSGRLIDSMLPPQGSMGQHHGIKYF